MASMERVKRWLSIVFALALAATAVLILLSSAALPQGALRAAGTANGRSPGAYPAFYLILERARDGRIRLLESRQVRLAAALHTMDGGELQGRMRGRPRDVGMAALILEDTRGLRLFQTAVPVPMWERGEFHGVHGGSIDGRYFPLERAIFAARVPAIPGATLRVVGQDGRETAVYAIDRLPATRAGVVATGTITDHIGAIGPAANRVDLLVVAEGFTDGQSAAFTQAATQLVNDFFSISPYRDYRNYVNVHTLFVPSPEAGADHPPYKAGCTDATCCADTAVVSDPRQGQFADTAFDAAFCANQIQRMIGVSSAKVLAAATAVPDWDEILVLVNDPTYGGSGGAMMVASTDGLSVQIAQHEYGHSFAGLADEYTLPVPNYPACSDTFGPLCEPNVTEISTRAQIKWAPWIEGTTPIPTEPQFAPQFAGIVGLFEGARYESNGMYRSGQDCIMRTLGKPYCQVPAQTYVFRLYEGGWGTPDEGISLLEPGTITPTAERITVWHPQSVPFAATVLRPALNPQVKVNWLLDEKPTGSSGDSYVFKSEEAQVGEEVALTLTARDETALVHPEMAHPSLTSAHTWLIDVGAAPRRVALSGPQTGHVNRTYTFSATVNLTSTTPLSYTWEATGLEPQVMTGTLQSAAKFRWPAAGPKEVVVRAGNGGGVATASHEIELYVPLSGLSITGPEIAPPGVILEFRAVPRPADASQPVAFRWSPEPLYGQETAVAGYRWTASGKKRIVVEATNIAGTMIRQERDVLILSRRVMLPLIRK